MKASEVIAKSHLCRQAARNIYPQDPDELFNAVWLKIAEKEIKDPEFIAKNPKHYFLRAMRNQAIEWHKRDEPINIRLIKEIPEEDQNQSNTPSAAFLYEWINSPSDNDNLQFLKNIITLAVNCKDNNDAIRLIGCSHRQYYNYKLLAKKQLYDDYHDSINSNASSSNLV